MEAKTIMQHMTDKLDDAKRSSSVSFSPTVEHLTRSQGGIYEIVLDNGKLLLIRPQITKSYANVNTNEQRGGSAKVAPLRNGRPRVPCCGSTGKVRSFYPWWLLVI